MAGGERGADTHAPRCLGTRRFPGDRAHPGGVLGKRDRGVPPLRPGRDPSFTLSRPSRRQRWWISTVLVKRHRTAKRERARLLEEFDQRYLGQTVARPPVAAGLPTVVADFLRSQLMQHVGPWGPDAPGPISWRQGAAMSRTPPVRLRRGHFAANRPGAGRGRGSRWRSPGRRRRRPSSRSSGYW